MPRPWDAVDYVEPVTDTMWEQFGNAANYNVVNGCLPQFSASGLTVTVTAGQVTHNGSKISVAEDTVTLVPDATNPLWAWIAVDSTGGAQVIHGTAAANPTVPELGDYVEIALVLVEPNQTKASACAVKPSKRMIGPRLVRVVSGGGATVATLDADVDALSVTSEVAGLAVSVAANTTYTFEALIVFTCDTIGTYHFGFEGPDGSEVGLFRVFGNNLSADFGDESTTGFVGTSGNGDDPITVAVIGTLITGSSGGSLIYKHVGPSATLKAKSRVELL